MVDEILEGGFCDLGSDPGGSNLIHSFLKVEFSPAGGGSGSRADIWCLRGAGHRVVL